MNNVANEVRLIGTLRNVALTERRLWAILATAGQHAEYVPVLVFAAKDEDAANFAARVAALADGAIVAVQGRLSLTRDLDEYQKPLLHPRTGHPLRRTEVIVTGFATIADFTAKPVPQAAAPAPASTRMQRPASGPMPPALAKPAVGLPLPARAAAMPQPRTAATSAGAELGTPAVPWA